MSLHVAKLSKNPLVLASAALVMHIGGALAGDSIVDIQQQTKEFLVGTPTAHSPPQSATRTQEVASPTADAQEFVKQLLLGTTASRVTSAEGIKESEVAGASLKTALQARPVAYDDMQIAVQQVLLGQHSASQAAQLAARPTR